MLAKRLIPCLDVDRGRVVKGVQFVDLVDAGDPVLIAKAYDDQGADELVFLDITASAQHRQTTYGLIKQVAENIFIPLTVGGGVKTVFDIQKLLNTGADKVAVNTAAIENPLIIQQASKRFGRQCIVSAIDVKKSHQSKSGFEVFSYGGRKPTSLDAVQWAKKVEDLGAGEILLTSMDQDGSQSGFHLEVTRLISEAVNIPVIASGGVGTLQHLVDGIVQGKADAVLAASIFHFGKHTIAEAKSFLAQNDIEVRR